MIGDKLKLCRERRNYTQKEVAEQLHIHRSTYSKYEEGKSEPNIEMLKKLTILFCVDFNYLLSND